MFHPVPLSASSVPMEPATPTSGPLLTPTTNRFTLFPIELPEAWAAYKKAQHTFWPAESVDMSHDAVGKLPEDDAAAMVALCAIYETAVVPAVVPVILALSAEVQSPEMRLLNSMIAQLHIHAEAFAMWREVFGRDPTGASGSDDLAASVAQWAQTHIRDAQLPFRVRAAHSAMLLRLTATTLVARAMQLKDRLPGLGEIAERVDADRSIYFQQLHYMWRVEVGPGEPSEEALRQLVALDMEMVRVAYAEGSGTAMELGQGICDVANRVASTFNMPPAYTSRDPPLHFHRIGVVASRSELASSSRSIHLSGSSRISSDGENAFQLDADF